MCGRDQPDAQGPIHSLWTVKGAGSLVIQAIWLVSGQQNKGGRAGFLVQIPGDILHGLSLLVSVLFIKDPLEDSQEGLEDGSSPKREGAVMSDPLLRMPFAPWNAQLGKDPNQK